MKHIIIIMFIAVVSSHGVFAQTAQGADGLTNMQGLSYGFGSYRTFDSRFKGVVGSPLLLESYVKGEIEMNDGTRVTSERINYDAFNDDLLVARNSGEIVVKKEAVNGFSLRNNGALLNFVKVHMSEGEAFYQQLVTGSVELFKKNKKRIEAGSESSTYNAGKSYSEFVADDGYAWRSGTGVVKEVKNRKALLSDFAAHKKEIEKFLKDENISFKSEENLIRLFRFLNQLEAGKGA